MAGEKIFETKVKKFLREQGCWYLKTWSNGVQRSGVPDLLICCNGYFLGVELKATLGRPSELQLWNVEKIREARGISIVLYPDQFQAFRELIYHVKNGYRAGFNSGVHVLQYKFDKYKLTED